MLRTRALGLAAALAAPLFSCGGDERDVGTMTAPLVVCAKGATTPGMDVSYYQGTINWDAVKASGIEFAIVRTGDGTFEDPQFPTYWSEAKRVGLIRGTYHFFRPGKDPVQQADIVIAKVGKLAAEDLPVTADVEATDGVPAATIVSKLHTFIDRIEAGTGKKPMIYTGTWFWDPQVKSSDWSKTPLWLSHYTNGCPNLPIPWADWAIHQYTDRGTVPGISGGVDLNRFNGTLADLKAFAIASSSCAAEVCNGKDDNCDGVIDDGEVCELEALHRDLASYAPPRTTDVNGDGKADVCGRGGAGLWCHLSTGTGFGAATPTVAISNAAGWDDPKYSSSLRMGDIDGDGKADACARGKDGVRCWLGSGTGLGTEVVGPNLTDASGWGDPAYGTTLRLADFDGDGRDDVCALAAKGVACWRSLGTSFGPQVDGPAWSTAAGYSIAKYYGTFRTADLDGDGRDDVCLRGPAGIECALSDGAGFPKKVSGPELSDASGWGDVSLWSTIRMADVTGDGRADLCARSKLDYQCWASTGFGFDRPVEVAAWSDAAGWSDPSNYRTIRAVDLDGDGAAEICGRGDDGIKCYKPGGTNPISGPAWTDAVGWSLPAYYDTIRAGDVDGDGKADLCARAAAGFRCIPSTGTGFAGEIASTEFSDKSGWDKEPYYPTILFGGPGKPRPHPGSRDGGAPGPVADGGSVQDAGIGGGDDGDGCACRTGAPRGSASGGAIVAAVAILLGAARRRRNRI